jgi:hypothetical protein
VEGSLAKQVKGPAEAALSFLILAVVEELVGRGGFEPPTNGLKVVFFPYASENDSS